MPSIKISFDQERYEKLMEMAQSEGVTIQDIIRKKVFDEQNLFIPMEAVKLAFEKFDDGTPFTLPDLYGDDWVVMKRGFAGVFGKNFYNYVKKEYPGRIEFIGMTGAGGLAQYQVISK